MARWTFAYLLFFVGISGVFSLRSSPKTPTTPNADAVGLVSSSRRQWLASAAGMIAATAAPIAANADPSVVSKVQGPLQDTIAPGHWIGQFVGLNSRKETWEFPKNTPEEVSKALVDVLEGLTPERKAKLFMPEFQIQKANSQKVHVLTWTKLEWLDTLDVTLAAKENSEGSGGGCVAKASFYATGFLPTNIPGAPIVNVGMAWFPFASPGPRGEMLQDFRLRALKGLVTKKLEESVVRPDLYV
eukprot:CAMPEP_0116137688 /NCGR_PEP_ID=MMETSP0329-20121206/12376_1 /TAXON_ID=697910 /ORGANISM="Pseudo-nitzschia arenysensis, Strain B593" /LENGTH=243 /DNA_ID=CAMNT_0003632609 /DNA_START=58 /DNA_END=789 /DNA_ORIENTATION=+